MTDRAPAAPLRTYQCPGCWAVSQNRMTADGYECECGERLFIIDFRDTETPPFVDAARATSTPAGLREALDNEIRSFVANVEIAAEDNGTPAVLIGDLWALARDWMRDRRAALQGADR